MASANETVSEVCAEMRYCKATSYSSSGCDGCNNYDCRDVRRFASRILAAYDREMAGVIAERDVEIRRRSTAERELAAKDAEIARLKSALKPVMECRIERIDGLDSPDGEFMTSSEYGVCDADGNEVDSHSIASALNAVREAQRIMKEGEAK